MGKKPVLVVMAAGMGSRYGGLKQIDPVGNHGQLIIDYLTAHPDGDMHEYVMAGYLLKNTVTEHGTVARGVCRVDGGGFLTSVTERTRIAKDGNDAKYTEDGVTWTALPGDTVVSMSLWSLGRSFLDEAWARFPDFLKRNLQEDPGKGKYFLPAVISQLIGEGRARVKVLTSADRWYGVTYREDKPSVTAAVAELTARGLYPDDLWGGR